MCSFGSGVGEPAARGPNAARMNIWYGPQHNVPSLTKRLNHFFHALGKCMVLQKKQTIVLFISSKYFAGVIHQEN